MKLHLLTLFLLPLSLCFSFSLKEKIASAKLGSYIVTEQNKTFTLLHLHSLTYPELILEEISIPSHLVDLTNHSWKSWVENGAEGHTSWILYTVDLDTDAVTECYSFTRQAHLPTESLNAFLTALIKQELTLVPEEERLKTGPTAKAGFVGASKPWGPSMTREGEKVKNPAYEVYTSLWPDDQTELSGKKMILYFDKEQTSFPFPYWIQARDGAFHYKVRAVDSGQNLSSPKKTIPRRLPTFIEIKTEYPKEIHFNLTAPKYYHDFKLYAVDITANPRHILTVPIQTKRLSEEEIQLEAKHLDEVLMSGHQYIWLVFSEEYNLYAESEHATLWSK